MGCVIKAKGSFNCTMLGVWLCGFVSVGGQFCVGCNVNAKGSFNCRSLGVWLCGLGFVGGQCYMPSNVLTRQLLWEEGCARQPAC